jgi:hypothetical protein
MVIRSLLTAARLAVILSDFLLIMQSPDAPEGPEPTKAPLGGSAPPPEEAESSRHAARSGAIQCGKQLVWIEPTLVHIRVTGEYTGDEVRAITAELDRFIAANGTLYLLVNIGAGFQITADARRASAEWSRGKPVGGLAVTGAGAHIRIIFSLLMRGIEMIGGPRFTLKFVTSDDDGRVWLEQQRLTSSAAVVR